MEHAITLTDGFVIPFPVFELIDSEVFKRLGVEGTADLFEDPIIGSFSPLFTSRRSCERTIRVRGLTGKVIVPLITPVELYAELTLILKNGVTRVVFDPDDDGPSYPLRDVLDLIPTQADN